MLVDNVVKKKAFQLKGRLYTLTVFQVIDPESCAFDAQLEQVIKLAPKMFDTTPIVLDFSMCRSESLDLEKLIACLKAKKLIPIGVQGVSGDVVQSLRARGLAIMSASPSSDREIAVDGVNDEQEVDTSSKIPSFGMMTKLITAPVRSGQQIYAKGSDLIVTSSVSRGAEVLADGNIHVYGCLRGRALAGIQGNQQNRIFCLDLDAELVSIAGIYALNDKIKQHTAGPKQISIREERIVIDELG